MKPIREQLAPHLMAEVVACERVRGRDFGCLWHFHPEFELTLVISGGSHRWVGDRITTLERGDLAFLGPGLPHDYRNDPVPGRLHKKVDALVIQFHPTFLGKQWLDHTGIENIKRLFQNASTGLQVTDTTRDRIERLMFKVLAASGVRRLIFLLEILEDLSLSQDLVRISSPGFSPEIHAGDGERMGAISSFIQENIDKPLYLADVARHVAMSEVTFSRYFRSRTGKTFPTYLNELRVARVCRLLVETDDTVSEIAWNCGFDSMANFQKQFSRMQGCTPKAYRRKTLRL